LFNKLNISFAGYTSPSLSKLQQVECFAGAKVGAGVWRKPEMLRLSGGISGSGGNWGESELDLSLGGLRFFGDGWNYR
jgi:hypothetical protein